MQKSSLENALQFKEGLRKRLDLEKETRVGHQFKDFVFRNETTPDGQKRDIYAFGLFLNVDVSEDDDVAFCQDLATSVFNFAMEGAQLPSEKQGESAEHWQILLKSSFNLPAKPSNKHKQIFDIKPGKNRFGVTSIIFFRANGPDGAPYLSFSFLFDSFQKADAFRASNAKTLTSWFAFGKEVLVGRNSIAVQLSSRSEDAQKVFQCLDFFGVKLGSKDRINVEMAKAQLFLFVKAMKEREAIPQRLCEECAGLTPRRMFVGDADK